MSQKKKGKKTRYRLSNWPEYNQALVGRGRITLWMDEDVLGGWLNTQKTGRRGASNTYSDLAVQCMGTLRVLFRLPLRATQGLTGDLLGLMGLSLPVLSYTQLCRRLRTLPGSLPKRRGKKDGPVHLVVDSTGLKVFGEGEWKVRQHGWCTRRTWRKLHLGMDADSHEILCVMFSTNDVADCEVFRDLLDQVDEPIAALSADGGYDASEVYAELARRKVQDVNIPPRKNARIKQHGNSKKPPLARDENLRAIRQIGRKEWKKSSGYHQRSKAETAMFRFKALFGGRLASRNFETQASDVFIGCHVLNTFTQLGMPSSSPIPI